MDPTLHRFVARRGPRTPQDSSANVRSQTSYIDKRLLPLHRRSHSMRLPAWYIVSYNVLRLNEENFQWIIYRCILRNVGILVLQSTCWDFSGEWCKGPFFIIHSGCSKHFGGVMILIHESIASKQQVETINELIPGRLLAARIRSKIYDVTIIGGYAPQSEAKSTMFSRSMFWSNLDGYLRRLPFRTLRLVLLDANAHVAHSPPVIGPHNPNITNSNGHSITNIAHCHDLALTNTLRGGRTSSWTWQSTDGVTRYRIDFILWMRRYLKSVAAIIGVDLSLLFSLFSSVDHRPVPLLLRVPTVA